MPDLRYTCNLGIVPTVISYFGNLIKLFEQVNTCTKQIDKCRTSCLLLKFSKSQISLSLLAAERVVQQEKPSPS